MKTRKIISLCVVIVLMLCMSANVLAAGLPVSGTEPSSTTDDTALDAAKTEETITVGSTLYLPTIRVTVSAPQSVIVNPYKMDYDGNGSVDSLISAPTKISSKSTIDMSIKAVPKGKIVPGSTVKFSAAPGVENDKTLADPTVYVELIMANFDAETDIAGWSIASGATESKAVATENNDEAATITLAKGDGNTATWGAYKFKGESGGPSWDTGDLIKIEVIFAIDPIIS